MATANCFYPEEPAKGYHGLFISNPNLLTSNDHLDPMYGSPDLTCLLCKVYKATDAELQEEVFKSEEYGFVPRRGKLVSDFRRVHSRGAPMERRASPNG